MMGNQVITTNDFTPNELYDTLRRDLGNGIVIVLERIGTPYRMGNIRGVNYDFHTEILRNGVGLLEGSFNGLVAVNNDMGKVMDVVIEHILTRLN